MELPESLILAECPQRQVDDQGREGVDVERIITHPLGVLEVLVAGLAWISGSQRGDEAAVVIDKREMRPTHQAVIVREISVGHIAAPEVVDDVKPRDGHSGQIAAALEMVLYPYVERCAVCPAHFDHWIAVSGHEDLAVPVGEVHE